MALNKIENCLLQSAIRGAIKSDAHKLGDASNYAGSARLALLAHPNARQALHSRITFNRTLQSEQTIMLEA